MITAEDLEVRVKALEEQVKQNGLDYAQAKKDLDQKMANYNALEGALMLARQMLLEERIKEEESMEIVADDMESSLS